MEICDLIVVTKSDDELLKLAISTASDYSGALHITRINSYHGGRLPSVILVSSKSSHGVAEVWKNICDYRNLLLTRDDWKRKRKDNQTYWMWRHLNDLIEAGIRTDENLQKQAEIMKNRLHSENLAPRAAARILFEQILTFGKTDIKKW